MTHAVDATIARLADFGDLPAIESAGATVTYRDLAVRVEDARRQLQQVPLTAGDRVILTSWRSTETIVAVLACIAAGITYVPVDDDAPDARREQIRDAVQPSAMLVPAVDGPTVELIDCPAQPQPAPTGTSSQGDPDELAILHTSGSTGVPKSVSIARRNLDHFLTWCRSALPLTSDDRIALLSPLHFDLCTHDLFHGLGSGATLVIPDVVEQTSPQAAARLIATCEITRVYMVPTFLEHVGRASLRAGYEVDTLTTVMFAGERLSPRGRDTVEAAYPSAQLHNLYGPIETNVITAASLHRGEPHDASDVGEALPGVELQVLDAHDRLTGSGRGELAVTGSAVTPGYLHPAHNSTKFVVAPDNKRWYRTGDEATIGPDHRVQLHGRLDSMVKIRGQRIELDEVETVVNEMDSVSGCAAMVSQGGESVEVFVTADSPNASFATRVIDHCRTRLPPVAVPSAVRHIAEIPVTATGKLDRNALRSRVDDRDQTPAVVVASSASPHTQPVDVLERVLSTTLGTSVTALRRLPALRDHPAFNSMIAAQCVEAAEDALGRSADYNRLTASSFDTIDSMGELFDHHG